MNLVSLTKAIQFLAATSIVVGLGSFSPFQSEKPVQTIYPTKFLTGNELSQVKFFDQDRQALVVQPTYIGSEPKIDLLDCETGKVTSVLRPHSVLDFDIPSDQQDFVIVVESPDGKRIRVEQYNLSGRRKEKLLDIQATQPAQKASVFWQPEQQRSGFGIPDPGCWVGVCDSQAAAIGAEC